MITPRLTLGVVLVLAIMMLGLQAVVAACPQHGVMPSLQGRGPAADRMIGVFSLDRLRTELNLTPDQVSRLEAIRQAHQTQRRAIMADTSLTREARRARLMDLRKSTHDQMMAVLTPEQRTKLQQLREQRKAAFFDRMATELGLTADQRTEVKAIHDQKMADIAAVRADATLTPEAKRARIREIRAAAMERLRGVLTPEQLAKLDSLHKGKKRPARAGAGPAAVPLEAAVEVAPEFPVTGAGPAEPVPGEIVEEEVVVTEVLPDQMLTDEVLVPYGFCPAPLRGPSY